MTTGDAPQARVLRRADERPMLLSVEGLRKRFGELNAIDDLSFSVHDGEFFTLLGPSGCGKSTTLMALAGFEQPDAGTIRLGDRDITREKPERRSMGVVFQNYALFPQMTVLDNVVFPLKMRGVARAEAVEKALHYLDLVELEPGRHGLRPGQLSGGQQQRVALARAMVFDPDVLLMDEPLSALDRRLRQHLQFQLRHLQARLNTTVIYVTHDQEEALVLSDRIGVMRRGRFDQLASPRDVYDRPATAFVAGFLGNSNQAAVRIVHRSVQRTTVLPLGEDGPELTVVHGDDAPPQGDAARLFVRPERVSVVPDTGDDGLERCSGVVTDVAFMGDHVRLEVSVFGVARWIVPVAGDALARLADRLRVGEPVTLGWRATDGRLLAEDD